MYFSIRHLAIRTLNINPDKRPVRSCQRSPWYWAGNTLCLLIPLLPSLPAYAAGPTYRVSAPDVRYVTTKSIAEKNYTKGLTKNAKVGEVMIRVKNYQADYFSPSGFMKPTENFEITGSKTGAIKIVGTTDDEYPILGTVSIDNTEHPVLDMGRAIALKPTGEFLGSVVRGGTFDAGKVLIATDDLAITPNTAKFIYGDLQELISSDHDYDNYEISYAGIVDGKIGMIARKYTNTNGNVPTFMQGVSFPPDTKTAMIRNLQLTIEKADNESISFVVISE